MQAFIIFGGLGIGLFCGGIVTGVLVIEAHIRRHFGIDVTKPPPRHVALRSVREPATWERRAMRVLP